MSAGDNSKGDKGPGGIELQVKISDNVNLNIKSDQLFDGAKASVGDVLGKAVGGAK